MSDEAYQTEEYREHIISIVVDIPPCDPRDDFDNLATMICFHGSYELGDKHDFTDAEEVMDHIKEEHAVYMPLFLYDHGGLTMSTGAFSCPWDSGQIGVIFIERDKWQREYGRKRMSKKLRVRLIKMMESEVAVYDAYLTGSVYGWTVEDADGEHVDSCFGYYGDSEIEYMLSEARSSIDHTIAAARAAAKLK